jgi:hypothetical protein
MAHPTVDKFGKFLMGNLRDEAIYNYDGLVAGRWKAPSLQKLQNDMASLTDEQRSVMRRCLIHCLGSGLHDFLFALQENLDFDNDYGHPPEEA